jgi:hypothetical protein
MGVVLRDEARRRNVEPGDILKEPVEGFLRQFVTEWSEGVATGGVCSSDCFVPRKDEVRGQASAQQSEAA